MPFDPTASPQQQAVDWFACLQGDADDGMREAFQHWHDSDPAHAAAFARVQRLWGDPDLAAALFAAASEKRTPPRRWPRIAVAAAMLLVLLAAAHLSGLTIAVMADHTAGTGLPQRVALSDGSLLVLDAGAAVTVAYDARQRDVTVLRGRVFAEVRPDAARPFRLRSGPIAAQALGTAYSLDGQAGSVTVAVQHGRVAVARREQPLATLVAGEAVALHDGSVQPAGTDSFAWTENRLVFADRSLSAVLAELDRYWPGKIIVRGEALADLKVSGSYRLDDPPAVAAALAAATGARISAYAGRLLILSP